MECKELYQNRKLLLLRRINRNIMECKVSSGRDGFSFGVVLIETLWNVKLSVRYENTYEVIVLIETLWNVKESLLRQIVREESY